MFTTFGSRRVCPGQRFITSRSESVGAAVGGSLLASSLSYSLTLKINKRKWTKCNWTQMHFSNFHFHVVPVWVYSDTVDRDFQIKRLQFLAEIISPDTCTVQCVSKLDQMWVSGNITNLDQMWANSSDLIPHVKGRDVSWDHQIKSALMVINSKGGICVRNQLIIQAHQKGPQCHFHQWLMHADFTTNFIKDELVRRRSYVSF